jgi:hypothetical protein
MMENNGVFIEAHIADIHFGAMEPNIQYNILKEQFIDKLAKMPVLDIVSINGDIFDHKFMASSPAIMVAQYFIKELIAICTMKHATLIIIGGTFSHDADQIKLFYPLAEQAKNFCDVRIVEECRYEYVKGKRILCIPELYGKGKDFYNSLMHCHGWYDSCYMHGTYTGSIYGKEIPDLDSQREPVFCMNDFSLCLGPIISGHVHNAMCFDSHFYYCGSPYRWSFADANVDKGFIFLLHDISTHTYSVQYEPIISDNYAIINLDDMIHNDPKDIIQFILKKKLEDNIKYIRVDFTQSEPEALNIIKTYFRNNKEVMINDKSSKEEILSKTKDIAEQYKDYDYIFDKNLTPEYKLAEYINQCKKEIYITADDLLKLLSDI